MQADSTDMSACVGVRVGDRRTLDSERKGEGRGETSPPSKPWEGLDPNAPRYKRDGKGNPNSKTLTFPMNEYEHIRLQEACKSADRNMLDFVRRAVKKAVAKELDE